MLALVCAVEVADRNAATDSPPEDLVRALVRLAASASWDEETDARARGIVADLYQASVPGQPEGHD